MTALNISGSQVLPKIRKKVNEDLAAPGLPQRKVIAVIMRLLDETCIRIGNTAFCCCRVR